MMDWDVVDRSVVLFFWKNGWCGNKTKIINVKDIYPKVIFRYSRDVLEKLGIQMLKTKT